MDATNAAELNEQANEWAKNVPEGAAAQIAAHIARLDSRLAERPSLNGVIELIAQLDMQRAARLPLWEPEIVHTNWEALGCSWDEMLYRLGVAGVLEPVQAATAEFAADVVERRLDVLDAEWGDDSLAEASVFCMNRCRS